LEACKRNWRSGGEIAKTNGLPDLSDKPWPPGFKRDDP
jgi:hypothetical protein